MKHNDGISLILIELSRLGCMAWRQEAGLFYDNRGGAHRIGVEGQADIIGVTKDGRAIAVEIKVGRDTLKPHQAAWAAAFSAHNGIHLVVRPDREGWEADLWNHTDTQ